MPRETGQFQAGYPQLYREEISPVILMEPLSVGTDNHRVEIPAGEIVLPILVPHLFLFGTQLPHVYKESKRETIEKALHSDGHQYLERDPVLACMLGNPQAVYLAVIDGHHNARYAPKILGPRVEIPVIIVAPPTAADLYYSGDTTHCINDLFKSMSLTQQKFEPYLTNAGKTQSQPIIGEMATRLWSAFPHTPTSQATV